MEHSGSEDGSSEGREAEEDEEEAEAECLMRCTVCGTDHLLGVAAEDLGDMAQDFCCSYVGAVCPPLRQAFLDDNDEAADGENGPFLGICGGCGSTRLVTLDVMGLGIDFRCSHIGLQCEDDDGGGQQRSFLEWERLVEEKKLALPVRERSLQARRSKIRYRDDQVVSHKGERFVKEDLTPSPGPGCLIGGVLGARKAGRLGLGLKKRPKEEVERICLSGKQRGHMKLDDQPRRGVRFETRRTHGALVPGGQGAGQPRSARPSGS